MSQRTTHTLCAQIPNENHVGLCFATDGVEKAPQLSLKYIESRTNKLLQRNNEAARGLIIMTVPKSSLALPVPTVTICLVLLHSCSAQLRAQLGTTPNIKQIVVGRCYNYITLINPRLRCDCEAIWRQFEEAVMRQSSCNVTMEDYHDMFNAVPQSWPCDRFLFWSKTRTLMHSYAAVVRDVWTLEDTLVGYMFNDLIWCGQEDDSALVRSGQHPDIIQSIPCGDKPPKIMFGSVELDGLNPQRVDYVNIKVVTNLEGPHLESCSQGSIVDLLQLLQSRGFRWTCSDNDQTLMILQCIQDPQQSSCQTCGNSLLDRKGLLSVEDSVGSGEVQ
ncbi:ADP-ribosyl cyclase/cyclic ADP-ribose hydrolase 1 [Channa argus]|uniref:ADP-ribosyl cyclase/cyclic ADP-ribose hydrolase n=1 Tax=Channa argus TaxID=215402 RepID=A0A6G1QND9_CHAAH|nr:ADP-ribosyl cyclase/cyclic ADP-ribose hydrolase 1 [Channa argus]